MSVTLEKLTFEEKVDLAISMTDVCIRICLSSIKDQDPTLTEEELLVKLRARIASSK